MTPPKECPARLSFPTAPYLDLRCTEPPGHGGLHRTTARVRTAVQPYGKARSEATERVYMQWAQDVDDHSATCALTLGYNACTCAISGGAA